MNLEPGERTTGHWPTSDDELADPERWLDRHGSGLYRYALLRLRSPDLAADIVQDTFVEALRVRGSFAGLSSERTWLIGILRHKILDHLRRSARAPAAVNGAPRELAHASAFDARGRWRAEPASWAGEPSKQLETREFWDVFGQCLAKLPGSLAEAFLLRELDGLSSDEVQQVLGITPANLWKRLHRARSLLRDCLESNWFGARTSKRTLGWKGLARR
jgi:RNA polymerase sigma-70 factor (ECF subfamily)